jgi:hypothetical protein
MAVDGNPEVKYNIVMNALIIGDSHILRLMKVLEKNQRIIPECFFPFENNDVSAENYEPSLCKYSHTCKVVNLPFELKMSFHKGVSAWKSKEIIEKINPCIKKIVNEDTVIFPAFGYIDSKIQLVTHKNPEEVVKRYVDAYLENFPNNKIRFIEPLPQFINNLGSGSQIFNFEDRYPNHLAFTNYLKEYCNEMGLDKPISQSDILGVDKLDESFECHDCAYCFEEQSIGMRWDHLKVKYNELIINKIIEKIV